MTARTNATPIEGDIHQWTTPNWEPILGLVGSDLTGCFMWMGEIRLVDGTGVHAYKHRDTRRYCHIAEDGRAFEYVPPTFLERKNPGSYRPIARLEAIDEAFYDWKPFADLPVDELAEMTRAVNAARATARRGEVIAVDRAELALQREFERAEEGRGGGDFDTGAAREAA